MSRRPPNVKTTKTSSVSSKASSSSKTASSGSNSRSVSKSRPGGKSPVPKAGGKNAAQKETTTPAKSEPTKAEPSKAEVQTGDKPADKAEVKDVNNNLTTADSKEEAGKSVSPIPPDDLANELSLDNQVPSKTDGSIDELSEIEKAKSKKSIKRKPSTMQHRNSKQDTAQLLRRKSLTPSAKLIILCKKGDWLAVETFLKQVDKKSIDTTVINDENNWTPLHYAARDNRVAVVERLIQLGE